MLKNHEKSDYDRNIDEIAERLSVLLADIMLIGLRHLNDKFSTINEHLEKDRSEDIRF